MTPPCGLPIAPSARDYRQDFCDLKGGIVGVHLFGPHRSHIPDALSEPWPHQGEHGLMWSRSVYQSPADDPLPVLDLDDPRRPEAYRDAKGYEITVYASRSDVDAAMIRVCVDKAELQAKGALTFAHAIEPGPHVLTGDAAKTTVSLVSLDLVFVPQIHHPDAWGVNPN